MMIDGANTAMVDGLRLKGEFDIVHTRNGVVLSAERISNLIVRTGREQVSKLLIGVDNRPFTHIQIGKGTTPASAEHTALVEYYAEARAMTSAIVDMPPEDAPPGTVPAYRSVLTYTFAFAEPVSITEAGIFSGSVSASPGPVMLSRQTFATRDVIEGDNLQVTWRFTIG